MRVCEQVPDFALGRSCIVYGDAGRCIDLQIDPDNINWHMGATIVIGERAVASAASLLGLFDPNLDVAALKQAVLDAEKRAAAAELELAKANGVIDYLAGRLDAAAVADAVMAVAQVEQAVGEFITEAGLPPLPAEETAVADDTAVVVALVDAAQADALAGDTTVDIGPTSIVVPEGLAEALSDVGDLDTGSKASKAEAARKAAAKSRAKAEAGE